MEEEEDEEFKEEEEKWERLEADARSWRLGIILSLELNFDYLTLPAFTIAVADLTSVYLYLSLSYLPFPSLPLPCLTELFQLVQTAELPMLAVMSSVF